CEHLDQPVDRNCFSLVYQNINEQAELGFEPDNSERRLIEFDLLFKGGVRRMIAAKNRQGAIGNSFDNGIDIPLCAQRRVHLAIGIEILNRSIRQRDMMWTNFAGNFHSTPARFANQPDTSRRADVLAMNMMIAKFR